MTNKYLIRRIASETLANEALSLARSATEYNLSNPKFKDIIYTIIEDYLHLLDSSSKKLICTYMLDHYHTDLKRISNINNLQYLQPLLALFVKTYGDNIPDVLRYMKLIDQEVTVMTVSFRSFMYAAYSNFDYAYFLKVAGMPEHMVESFTEDEYRAFLLKREWAKKLVEFEINGENPFKSLKVLSPRKVYLINKNLAFMPGREKSVFISNIKTTRPVTREVVGSSMILHDVNYLNKLLVVS